MKSRTPLFADRSGAEQALVDQETPARRWQGTAKSVSLCEWTPGGVRSEMEKIQAQVSALEADLSAMVTKGAVGYVETRHELVEASDALHRAVEILDNSYSSIS